MLAGRFALIWGVTLFRLRTVHFFYFVSSLNFVMHHSTIVSLWVLGRSDLCLKIHRASFIGRSLERKSSYCQRATQKEFCVLFLYMISISCFSKNSVCSPTHLLTQWRACPNGSCDIAPLRIKLAKWLALCTISLVPCVTNLVFNPICFLCHRLGLCGSSVNPDCRK